MTTPVLDDEIWAGIVRTLETIGPVLTARRQVGETIGTAAEAHAIDRLGRRLADLEDAFGALRTTYEQLSKDA